MTNAQFIIRIILYALVLTCVVAVVNIVVDPYLFTDAPRISGFNDRKPAAAKHEKSMKRYDAPRRQARTLIIGSSRTGVGFNPSSDKWRKDDQTVYNLSLVGAGISGMIDILRYFIASRATDNLPNTIIVGLDFSGFLHPLESEPDTIPHSYASIGLQEILPPENQSIITEIFQSSKKNLSSMLSLAALSDSFSTVLVSYRGGGMTLDQRGWIEESKFLESTLANGVEGLFRQKNTETIKQYDGANLGLLVARDDSVKGIPTVRDIVLLGTNVGAKVILFIQPAHVDRWELFDRFGYWDDFEQWKRTLGALVDQLHQDGADVELWDFAGYESYMQESPFARKDRASLLTWFWEPAHYNSALGDILIGRMRGVDVSTDLGIRLTGKNLEHRLSRIRADRQNYRRSHTDEIERISSLLCSSQKGCMKNREWK
ncbi:MAG: hypothetical protein QNK38_03410 [Nitrospirota bacterium]|nr:hypothetical protein [Nitrospirota bacterium]